MAQKAQVKYNQVKEKTSFVGEREFRIGITQVQPSEKFLVVVREYITSDTYTGFSRKNGLTIPVDTLDQAEGMFSNLANSFK